MTWRRTEGRRHWWAVAWAALLLFSWIVIAPGDDHAPAAWANSPAASISPASLPPALQALEQKMEQLRINSERYSQTTHGEVTVSVKRHGKHGERTSGRKRVSLNHTELGEASLSPSEAEVIDGNTRKPILIAIGSTLYTYSATLARRDGGRPWFRFNGHGAASVGRSSPTMVKVPPK